MTTPAPLPDSDFLGISPDRWDVIGSAATASALLIGALAASVAIFQLRHSRRIHRDQTRPYVVITAEPSPVSMTFMDIVVRNIGTTPAYDVTIDINPPLERAREDTNFPISKARVLSETMPMWAPGFEFRQFFDSHVERQSVQKEREAANEPLLPEVATATLTYYNSPKRRWRRREHWVETQVLDLAIGKGSLSTEIYGVHHAAKALREIEKLIKRAKLDQPRQVVVESREESLARQRAHFEQRKAAHETLVARVLPRAETEDADGETSD